MEAIEVEWDDEAVAHVLAPHGVTGHRRRGGTRGRRAGRPGPRPGEQDGQFRPLHRWSTSRNELLVVIVVHDGDVLYGGNAWPANAKGPAHLQREEGHVMNDRIPARVKAALDAEIAADTEDEAGRAYREGLPDAAEWVKPARAGRPSLSGGSTRSPQIGVRLPSDLKQRLEERATHDGVRESDVVREALEAFLTA